METLLETYRIRPDLAEKTSRNPGNACTQTDNVQPYNDVKYITEITDK